MQPTQSWTFEFWGELPPQTNNLFFTSGKYRIPTPAYKDFKKAIFHAVQYHANEFPFSTRTKLVANIVLYSPDWMIRTKSSKLGKTIGDARKADVDNRLKALFDAVSEAERGFRDENVWQVTARKQSHAERGFRITLTEFTMEP